jgi:hypothetical protein
MDLSSYLHKLLEAPADDENYLHNEQYQLLGDFQERKVK